MNEDNRVDLEAVRRFLLVSLLAVVVVGSFTAVYWSWFYEYDPAFADIKNDWIVASALVNSDNPYDDLNALSERYSGNSYESSGIPGTTSDPTRTPRTPGAILLSTPWTLLPISEVTQWNNILALFLAIPIVGLVSWHRSDPVWILGSVAIVLSAPMLWNLKFSNISMLVAAAVAVFLNASEHDRSAIAGLSIALATTIKVIPGILFLLVILQRRWTTLSFGLAGLAILNLGPLLLPEVRLFEAIDALAGATERFGHSGSNISVGYAIAESFGTAVYVLTLILVFVLVAVWIRQKPKNPAVDSLLLLGLAILLGPMAWAHYAIIIFPMAIALLIDADGPLLPRILVGLGFLFMAPLQTEWLTAIGIATMVFAAVISRTAKPPTLLRRPLSSRVSTH
jgi:hypothetical protein